MQLEVNKSWNLIFTPRTRSESCLHPYSQHSCTAAPDSCYSHLLVLACCEEVSDIFFV